MNYQDFINHFSKYLASNKALESITQVESLKTQKSDADNNSNNETQNNLVYENDDFQLFMIKRLHKKNIRFRLQDSVFEVKIELKKPETQMPKLQNLLDSFAEALVMIIESVQSFFPPTDENIAYFTIHQSPMMKGIRKIKSS